MDRLLVPEPELAAAYARGKLLWLEALRRYPDDLVVAKNAAMYLVRAEPVLGIRVFDQQPARNDDIAWLSERAHYCDLWLTSLLRSEDVEERLRVAAIYRKTLRTILDVSTERPSQLMTVWSLRDCARRMGDVRRLRLFREAYVAISAAGKNSQGKPVVGDIEIARGLVALGDDDLAAGVAQLDTAKALGASEVLLETLGREVKESDTGPTSENHRV